MFLRQLTMVYSNFWPDFVVFLACFSFFQKKQEETIQGRCCVPKHMLTKHIKKTGSTLALETDVSSGLTTFDYHGYARI